MLGIETSVPTLAIGEAGTGTFGVRLTAQPLASTTVAIASNDTGAATGAPAALTFTTANWATYQTVTVAGVSDPDAANETVTISATSAGLTTRTVVVTVTDDDTQDIVLTTTAVGLSEGGTATFGVRLAAQPLANVTVSVASSDPGAATVAPATDVHDGQLRDQPDGHDQRRRRPRSRQRDRHGDDDQHGPPQPDGHGHRDGR